MAKISKRKLTVLIIVVGVAVIAGIRAAAWLSPKAVDSIAARSKGEAQAKVQIIEFIDFQCPACAGGSKLLREYMAKHPGSIRVQVKYFPLVHMHSHAMQAALYSECAGRQGKFWEFHELLMPQQPQWSPLLSADPVFQDMAKQAGLNAAQLSVCLASATIAKVIDDDRSLGKSLGVQSTPTYFINNKMVVGTKSLTDELNTHFQ